MPFLIVIRAVLKFEAFDCLIFFLAISVTTPRWMVSFDKYITRNSCELFDIWRIFSSNVTNVEFGIEFTFAYSNVNKIS